MKATLIKIMKAGRLLAVRIDGQIFEFSDMIIPENHTLVITIKRNYKKKTKAELTIDDGMSNGEKFGIK